MKINNLLIFTAAIFVITGCSKNEGSDIIPSPESDPIEDVILDANMVSNNFVVVSSTKVQGSLPQANGNIQVQIATEEQSAFLKTGFNIEFEPSSTVTGAYIQIIDEDGVPSNSYFDIPASGFGAGFYGPSDKDIKLLHAKNGDEENVINVDFDLDMTPGTFCYQICFYDDEGNISLAEEICVEVESWGGFSALAGDWKFQQYTSDVGVVVAGENVCVSSDENLPCNDGSSLQADAVCQSTSIDLIMKEDGNFQLYSDQVFTYLDVVSSLETCIAVYEEPTDLSSYYEGKWAYDEEEDKMTLVYFNGVSLGIELDTTSGQLGYEGITTVSGNTLTINLEFDNPLTEEKIVQVYTFGK